MAEVSGIDAGDYDGYIAAIENRRQYFKDKGAVSADHSHLDARTDTLEVAEAERIYASARKGEVSEVEATALRRHLVSEMARMACDDGLVMTLHPGVWRNHHMATSEKYGADVGTDIPVQMEFTEALRPMLNRYGTHPNFQLVIFTLDETVFSREIGPLAGFYPGVFAGVPWWFIDAPEAIRRFRGAITESAGFAKTSGFIDDTRAFCSIPARHDMSRRLDAGFVAHLVAEHRLGEDEATEVMHDLVVTNPRRAVQTVTTAKEVPRLSRSLPDTPPAAPVRMVHLGVGNFTRAHQAWYTAHSPDADQWGIAAFTGRRRDTADALAPQDGLYTLITRSAEGDTFELIGALSAVHAAAEHEAYLAYLSRPELAVVTITVTEAGYLRGADGHLDAGRDVVVADLDFLRSDPRNTVSSLPARLVAGLLARRAAGEKRSPFCPVTTCPKTVPSPGPWSKISPPWWMRHCPTGSTPMSISPPRWWTGSRRPPPMRTARWWRRNAAI